MFKIINVTDIVTEIKGNSREQFNNEVARNSNFNLQKNFERLILQKKTLRVIGAMMMKKPSKMCVT